MAASRFLVDTSVFARLKQPTVAARFASLSVEGRLAVCAPVAYEIGHSARSRKAYDQAASFLLAFPLVPVTQADHDRALEVQATLGKRGKHRALSLVDGLVAAVAEARDLTVLHYDADFEIVAGVTGQPHRWIVERGAADA